MKKAFIFMLVIMFAFAVDTNAQTYKYYSTDFAYKTKDRYGYWSGWSD